MESDMMTKINKMLEKSKAFEKEVKDSSSLIQEKNKMGVLKEKEWNKLTEFAEKYLSYLSKEERLKALQLFENGERMDKLIQVKLSNLDISKFEGCKEAIKLADMSFNSKYKIFNQLNDMFKSSIDKQSSNATISKMEVDVFNILLSKRDQEKQVFLNTKNKFLKSMKEKLDNVSKNSSDIFEKTHPMVKETKSSSMLKETDTSFVEGNISTEVPLSEELLNIAKEILELFT
jgi:hypothetical protein